MERTDVVCEDCAAPVGVRCQQNCPGREEDTPDAVARVHAENERLKAENERLRKALAEHRHTRVGPTPSEKRRLVDLLARYILTDGAHIKRQEKAYNAYFRYFEQLEAAYPNTDFRSETAMQSLAAAAKMQASKKLFRGPGATC